MRNGPIGASGKPETRFNRPKQLSNVAYHINKEQLDELVKDFYDTGVMSNELGLTILNLIQQVKGKMWGAIHNYGTYEIESAEGAALDQIITSLNKKQIQFEKGYAYNYMWSIIVTRFLNTFGRCDSRLRRLAEYVKQTANTNKSIEQIIDELNNCPETQEIDED